MERERMRDLRGLAHALDAWPRQIDVRAVLREALDAFDAERDRYCAAADALGDLIDAIDKPDASIMTVRGAVIALESRAKASPWPLARRPALSMRARRRQRHESENVERYPVAVSVGDGPEMLLDADGAEELARALLSLAKPAEPETWERTRQPETWVCAGCDRKHVDPHVGMVCACGSRVRP